MDWNEVLPVLNLSMAELAGRLWDSVPALLTGLAVAALLVYLRRLSLKMQGSPALDGGPEEALRTLRRGRWWLWPFRMLRRLSVWYLVALGVLVAVQGAQVSDEMREAVRQAFRLLSIVQLGLLLGGLARDSGSGYLSRVKADGARILLVNTLVTAVTLLVWTVMLLMALNTLGVNVTALLAGLGLGGIAIAFATKNIFENVLASFMMVMNPPFVIGDFIIAGDLMGSVESISLKSVQLRAPSGEQVIVPNSELLNGQVRNFARMRERRIELKFGVGYEGMEAAKLERIPPIIRAAVERHGDKVRFDRSHLAAYGDDLIRFETIYFVTSPDYALHMDIQQAVLLEVYRELEQMGVGLGLSGRMGALGGMLRRG